MRYHAIKTPQMLIDKLARVNAKAAVVGIPADWRKYADPGRADRSASTSSKLTDTGKNLNNPAPDTDLGSPKIDAFEAIDERGTCVESLLQQVGMLHHGYRVIEIKVVVLGGFAGESGKALACFCDPVLSNEPPWGFRSKAALSGRFGAGSQ